MLTDRQTNEHGQKHVGLPPPLSEVKKVTMRMLIERAGTVV